jgi:hypothetical protein
VRGARSNPRPYRDPAAAAAAIKRLLTATCNGRWRKARKPALRVAAAANARLGRRDEAHTAIARMGQIDPAFRMCDVRKVAPFRRPTDLEKFEDSLRKAGLPE